VGSATWASGSTEMMRCHASHNAICAEAVPFTWMPLFHEFDRAVLPIPMFYSLACWCYPLVTCAQASDLSIPEHRACHCCMEDDGCAVNCTSRERLMSCG
jgi:hypothetical protein